jgi:hypothetical protein
MACRHSFAASEWQQATPSEQSRRRLRAAAAQRQQSFKLGKRRRPSGIRESGCVVGNLLELR